MSSRPNLPPSTVYNPSLFSFDSEYLTLADADLRYNRIGGDVVANSVSCNQLYLAGSVLDVSVITGITPGTAMASKALIVNANRDIANIRNLTTTKLLIGNSTDTSRQISALTGGLSQVCFGAFASNMNQVELKFNYVSDASLSNNFSLGFYGSGYTDILNINGSRHVKITGSLEATAQTTVNSLIVNGALTSTANVITCSSTLQVTGGAVPTIGNGGGLRFVPIASTLYLSAHNHVLGSDNHISIGDGKIYVKNDGMVGIGNSTPAYKLDITGDCNIGSGVLRIGTTEVIDASRNGSFANVSGTITTANQLSIIKTSRAIADNACGFEDISTTTLTYDASTRVLTITGTGYYVWVKSQRYTKSTLSTTAHATTQGATYYVYFDSSGNLRCEVNMPSLLDVAMVAIIYYYDLTHYVVLEERHGATMDSATHQHLHNNIGTYYVSGLALADYTLSATTDAGNTFSCTTGIIADEDLRSTITAIADDGPYCVFSMTGASALWTYTTGNTLPYAFGTYIKYNQWTGSAWTLTELDTNKFVNYYLVFAPSLSTTTQLLMIPSQTVYTNLTDAKAESFGSLTTSSLLLPEYLVLYQMTMATSASLSTSGKCQIASMTRISGSKSTTSVSTVNNHQSLSGLQLAGTGSTYGHINDTTQTIAGAKTFSNIMGITSTDNDALTITNSSNAGLANIKYVSDSMTWEHGARGSLWGAQANAYYLYANGGFRQVVKTDGKTGIGVDDPLYQLHVGGDISLSGSLRNGATVFMNNSGVLQVANQSAITGVGSLLGVKITPTNTTVGGLATTNVLWASTADRYWSMNQPDLNTLAISTNGGGTVNNKFYFTHLNSFFGCGERVPKTKLDCGAYANNWLLTLYNLTAVGSPYHGFGVNSGSSFYYSDTSHKFYHTSKDNAQGTLALTVDSAGIDAIGYKLNSVALDFSTLGTVGIFTASKSIVLNTDASLFKSDGDVNYSNLATGSVLQLAKKNFGSDFTTQFFCDSSTSPVFSSMYVNSIFTVQKPYVVDGNIQRWRVRGADAGGADDRSLQLSYKETAWYKPDWTLHAQTDATHPAGSINITNGTDSTLGGIFLGVDRIGVGILTKTIAAGYALSVNGKAQATEFNATTLLSSDGDITCVGAFKSKIDTSADIIVNNSGRIKSYSPAGIIVYNSDYNTTQLELSVTDYNAHISTANSSALHLKTNNIDRIYIGTTALGNGNICMHGTNYDYPLTINKADGSYSGSYHYWNSGGSDGSGTTTGSTVSLYCTGRVLCTGEVDVISDERVKDDIKPIKQQLASNFIRDINPKQFRYKQESDTSYGYIAQDLLKAGFYRFVQCHKNKALVETIDSDGFQSTAGIEYSINTGYVIPLLHLKVKELCEVISKLEKRIDCLEDMRHTL